MAIAQALRAGADIVVVTGRVADPSLTVGPALAHFGWSATDWDRLAAPPWPGHLLECGAQVTGGYYADPGCKDVPGLASLGFPIAEIDADGTASSPRPPAPAAWSMPQRSRSSCSTRCTIRPPTSRPTWSPTSRRRGWRRGGPTGCA